MAKVQIKSEKLSPFGILNYKFIGKKYVVSGQIIVSERLKVGIFNSF